jgi:Cu2+-containing amine oxidase
VLHDIRYDDVDKGCERPIIYRAAIVEMTVPYGDRIQTHGARMRSTSASTASGSTRTR